MPWSKVDLMPMDGGIDRAVEWDPDRVHSACDLLCAHCVTHCDYFDYLLFDTDPALRQARCTPVQPLDGLISV